MKRSMIYIAMFLCLFFVFPALLTDTNTNDNQNSISYENEIVEKDSGNIENKDKEKEEKEIFEEEYVGKYSTIKLLNHKTGIVEDVKLEEYLVNVVSAEMPVDFEVEALKAQSLVARTYTIYKMQNKKHDNADICTNYACCQAWISKEDRLAKWEENIRESNWNRIKLAVKETAGKIVTYNGKPINAFFHSNSGGITEVPVNVWGGTGYPYLQVVQTAGEDLYSQYSSEAIFTYDELLNKLKCRYSDIVIDFNNLDDIKILEYTDGNRVKTIKFGNHELSGVETRTLLALRSADFDITRNGEQIIFSVIGYGHGVGMSQTGADSLAKQGLNYEQIINHYYKDIKIEEISNIN